jgi:hypothetical protein
MDNLWATYGRGMGKRWRTSFGGGIRHKELGIRRLGSCKSSLVVIPTGGRDLWWAEKESIGEGQDRTPYSQQPYSNEHRSFQDDKVIFRTDHRQVYSITNQVPPCGRDDKVRGFTGR